MDASLDTIAPPPPSVFADHTGLRADMAPALFLALAHVDRVLAMLVDLQARAEVLRHSMVQAQASASDSRGREATMQQLRQIEAALVEQQAQLEGYAAGEAGPAKLPAWDSADARPRASAQAQAQRQSELRAYTGADSAEMHQGPARPQLFAMGPSAAAAAGLGTDGNLHDDESRPVQLPAGEHEALDGIVSHIGGMLRPGREPRPIGTKQRLALKTLSMQPSAESVAGLKLKVNQYVSSSRLPQNMDITQLIQWVIREGYVGTNKDLHQHARKVQFYTQLKEQLRHELSRAQTYRSSHRVGEGNEAKLDTPYERLAFSFDPLVSDDGKMQLRDPETAGTTVSLQEMEAYIKNLENSISTVGDDAQLAQIDLQTMFQNQTRALNVLSNVSKLMHDTAMSIIRKVAS